VSKPPQGKSSGGIKIVTENRKARHDYSILDTYEAGMELRGSEVKSLRNGQCQLKDSYVVFMNNQMYLQNAHISVYSASSYNNHEPERRRRLLMHRHEMDRLASQVQEKGLSIVPLKIYFKDGRAKIELALAKGKKAHDKRDSIKAKDVQRDISKSIRRDR
jgi:SsrA-binding protein